MGSPLRVGDKGANITETHNEEGNCLEVEIYEEMILPKGEIIAGAEEEEGSKTELQKMDSDDENNGPRSAENTMEN